MGSEEPPTQPEIRVAANTRVNVKVRSIPNIILLVAGTTNPGNISGPDEHRAGSYSKAAKEAGIEDYWVENVAEKIRAMQPKHWYWADNPNLRVGFVELRDSFYDVRLFPYHAWSGNNHPANRKVAGAYLCNRVHGGGGEKPFFPRYHNQKVHFHLVGHSHGGNVMNEFISRAAQSPDWPPLWKIRSVVYLSTPYFTKLHQPDTGALHENCEILSVNNEYDLTQKVLADFSLHHLKERIEAAGGHQVAAAFKKLLESITGVQDLFMTAVKSPGVAVDFFSGGDIIDPSLTIRKTAARPLYDKLVEITAALTPVAEAVQCVLDQFKEGVSLDVPKSLNGLIEETQQVLSPSLYAEWTSELKGLKQHAELAHASLLSRRRADSRYTWNGLIRDLKPEGLLQTVARLLELDSEEYLNASLWTLIARTLNEQTVVFDNTSTSPDQLYAGTPYASKITMVDVTDRDEFHKKIRPERTEKGKLIQARVRRLISALEQAETVQAPLRRSLRILTVLLANDHRVRALVNDWSDTADFVKDATRFLEAVGQTGSIIDILQAAAAHIQIAEQHDVGDTILRDASGSPVHYTNPVTQAQTIYGSLEYFLIVSHSVSRIDFHQEIDSFLRDQITCKARPNSSKKP